MPRKNKKAGAGSIHNSIYNSIHNSIPSNFSKNNIQQYEELKVQIIEH